MLLFEKYGIFSFDNTKYTAAIENIISSIDLSNKGSEVVDFISDEIKFNKVSVDLSHVLSWIDTLDIYYYAGDEYYNLIDIMHGPAIVSCFRNDVKYYKCNGNHIVTGSIFLAVNADKMTANVMKGILKMVYHELGHLHTNRNLNVKQQENNDLVVHFSNDDYSSAENIEAADITNDMPLEMIYNIFSYMMYYFNLSESHAYMENINFELEKSLHNFKVYRHNLMNRMHVDLTQYNTFKYASATLSLYVWMNELICALYKLSDNIKAAFDKKYHDDIEAAYGKFIPFNKLLSKYCDICKHIILNSEKIYAYYYALFNCGAVNESNVNIVDFEHYI